MTTIIDNATGKVLDEAIKKLPTKEDRKATYTAKMNDLLDQRNAPWPSDGQPGDMGDRVRRMMRTPVSVRVAWMFEAKYGGLTASELDGLNQIGG